MHTIIVVNGLGGEKKPLEWVMKPWKKYGFDIIVFHVDWKNKQSSFGNILNTLVNKVDSLAREGKVSLIGCSAGASLVLNAFLERNSIIANVINICGPVRREGAKLLKLRSINWYKDISPLLIQSLDQLESKIDSINPVDAEKIMTIRAQLGDELVPPETVIIPNATNIQIIAVEHTVAIYAALTIYKRKLIDFLNKKHH